MTLRDLRADQAPVPELAIGEGPKEPPGDPPAPTRRAIGQHDQATPVPLT